MSYVSRVHQLDAIIWNDELYSLLRARLRTAEQYFSPRFLSTVEPKLEVLFKCIFLQLPLELYRGTFGHRLLEMEYWDSVSNKPTSRTKLRLLTLLRVCLPSLLKIFAQQLTRFTKTDLQNFFEAFENRFDALYKFLTLMNFYVFLQNSAYPSILDRILGVRPVYISPQKISEVSYEGLNRELLWHGFAELLAFILPIVNIQRIKGTLKRRFKFLQYEKKPRCDILNCSCAICGHIPIYPHEIGCSHIFCYYCVACSVLADPQYSCRACSHEASGFASVKPLPIRIEK